MEFNSTTISSQRLDLGCLQSNPIKMNGNKPPPVTNTCCCCCCCYFLSGSRERPGLVSRSEKSRPVHTWEPQPCSHIYIYIFALEFRTVWFFISSGDYNLFCRVWHLWVHKACGIDFYVYIYKTRFCTPWSKISILLLKSKPTNTYNLRPGLGACRQWCYIYLLYIYIYHNWPTYFRFVVIEHEQLYLVKNYINRKREDEDIELCNSK